MRGIRHVARKKRSTSGRRVEEGVLGEVGYAGLKACHQEHYCLEMETMATIHGDNIIAEGEPEKMDRLGEILRWSWLEVPGSNKPEAFEHGRHVKGQMDSERQGAEWMEDPRQLAAIISSITTEEGAGTKRRSSGSLCERQSLC